MLKGIDLSYWQKSNYKTLIDYYAKDFVIVRAGWRYSVDPMCDPIFQYARLKGKKLGFYFFPLTSDGEPEKHAEWAYKQVLGYLGVAIPILDWEAYSGAEGKNDASNTDWALRWLKRFEELSGVKPMIYMNSNCNSIYDWSAVAKNDNGLWIANYGSNNGKDNGRPAVKYWKFAAMHQFTSLGISSGLDCNTFYGDNNAWGLYAKVKNNAVVQPSQKTYTDLEVQEILNKSKVEWEARVNEIERKLKDETAKLTVCEKVVNNAKNAIKEINEYGN